LRGGAVWSARRAH